MSFKTVTAGGVAGTPAAFGIGSAVAFGITGPLNAFKSETAADHTSISERGAGQAVLTGMVAGFVLGDMFGGKVPVLGKRRE